MFLYLTQQLDLLRHGSIELDTLCQYYARTVKQNWLYLNLA